MYYVIIRAGSVLDLALLRLSLKASGSAGENARRSAPGGAPAGRQALGTRRWVGRNIFF
jgi:hypothetical protein